jgi:predicted RNase H-related nuclease YkuK (DUF458 family)
LNDFPQLKNYLGRGVITTATYAARHFGVGSAMGLMKAAQLYLDLADCVGDRHFEVHLDINPDVMHGSSCVATQAVGYVRGMCNVIPLIKPNAFAASYAADRLKDILAA